MKYTIYLLSFLFLFSCANSSSPTATKPVPSPTTTTPVSNYKNIDGDQFKSRMGQPGVFILDVRTPAETNEGKIRGAVEIDYRAAGFKDKISKLPRDKEYLVYCRSGGRSSDAAQLMVEMGFSNVSNLLGGYLEWKE